MDLVVSFPEAEDFKYQTYPVAFSTPSFAANLAAVRDTYYQVEIFSTLGSCGHDIMGYSKDQVIADMLDSYDAHIMYLTMNTESAPRRAPSPSRRRTPGTTPTR